MKDEIIVLGPDEAFQGMVKTFNMSIGAKPDPELRANLIKEEAEELIDAVQDKDVVQAIDALCDLLYVIYGAADVFKVYVDTVEVSKTSPSVTEPDWIIATKEIEDFKLQINETLKCIRIFNNYTPPGRGPLKRNLTELAVGLWKFAAGVLGVDLRPYFREVHRTNMLKMLGPMREDGKKLKPEGWKPPRLSTLYDRSRAGLPLICEVYAPIHRNGPHEFNKAYVQQHSEGGHHCTKCGGLFLVYEMDLEIIEGKVAGIKQ